MGSCRPEAFSRLSKVEDRSKEIKHLAKRKGHREPGACSLGPDLPWTWATQSCVSFATTNVLHNSLCINIHANNARLCNHAVITGRQEAAASNCTTLPPDSPSRSLQAPTHNSSAHRRGRAVAAATAASRPGRAARQPGLALQGCHELPSCATRLPQGGGNYRRGSPAQPAAPRF